MISDTSTCYVQDMRKTLTMKYNSEDIDRFIEAIEADEHLRARVERAILSDRMYELPDKLAELTEAVRKLSDLVAEYIKKTDERLNRIESDIGILKSDVGTLKSDVSTLKSDVSTLKSDVGTLKSDVSTLKGSDYERVCREHAPAILGQVYGGMRRLRSIRREELADSLDDALDEGKITQKERDDVLKSDIAMKAVSKRNGEDVYLAVEVSVTAGQNDVERALQRAMTLEKTFGEKGIGVVIARTIPENLDTSGVEVAVYGYGNSD